MQTFTPTMGPVTSLGATQVTVSIATTNCYIHI
uniref:Uncharacterized protein n=1 Tax=Timema genevievae TaxID=629358 RepID=A0A7R9K655_TIMGE|nr:unnamed protein product [Timema genevievae]